MEVHDDMLELLEQVKEKVRKTSYGKINPSNHEATGILASIVKEEKITI